MQLSRLRIKDKKLFDKFLNISEHKLSVYKFESIYIWKNLYHIGWKIIEGSLCVFFRDKIGCFLYLPPLGPTTNADTVSQVFKIMDGVNSNKDISRIENLEEKDVLFYKGLGYRCRYKSSDYVCERIDLEKLKGDRFKSKRACCNYFVKRYPDAEYLPFSLKYKDACLELFDLWAGQRKSKLRDAIYQGMIDDSRSCVKILLDSYGDLNIAGRTVKVDKGIRAFSFGFELNQDTFCILFEITDLSIKGLAQFVFREFCSELKEYRQINIMDDSGLENLKKVKLSYHPVSLIPAYIADRKPPD